MAVSQRTRMRRLVRRALETSTRPASEVASAAPARPIHLASPGQIAVIYRWCTWVLALGLIVTGASMTYGPNWHLRPDVYLLLGLTFAVNLLLTLALRPYMRLMRRFPPIVLLDVIFCLSVYAQSSIWTSPFQFYSYSALMLPVAIFFYTGALAGSLVFLALNLALLYAAGYSFAWAQAGGVADTYLMQLAIVPLLAFVFAYPNRLYAQLVRAQHRLAMVEREQILLSERTRIAGSLHDSVAQLLFGIGMLAETAQSRLREPAAAPPGDGAVADVPAEMGAVAETLRQVHDLAARGNREMRRAIYSLREAGPAPDGLPAALSGLLADLAARTGIETHLTVTGLAQQDGEAAPPDDPGDPDAAPAPADLPDLPLPEPVAVALYQVAREALANIEKHAGALNVWVTLRVEESRAHRITRVTLVVRDDGHGFRRPVLTSAEVEEDELGVPHFGLSNMRSATEAVGGRFELASGTGRGTTLTAAVPLA